MIDMIGVKEMLVNNTRDSMLIKLIRFDDDDREQMIAAYFCTLPSEQLKIYQFCKEEEIDIHFNDEVFFIDNIIVEFGDVQDEVLPVIKVVVS